MQVTKLLDEQSCYLRRVPPVPRRRPRPTPRPHPKPAGYALGQSVRPLPINITHSKPRSFWLFVVSCSCCICCAAPLLLVTQKGGGRPCPFFSWDHHHRPWVPELLTESGGFPSVALLIVLQVEFLVVTAAGVRWIDPPKKMPSGQITISYLKLFLNNNKKPQMDGFRRTVEGAW